MRPNILSLFLLPAISVVYATAQEDADRLLEKLFHPSTGQYQTQRRGGGMGAGDGLYSWLPTGALLEQRMVDGKFQRQALEPTKWKPIPATDAQTEQNIRYIARLAQAGAPEDAVRNAAGDKAFNWSEDKKRFTVTIAGTLYFADVAASSARRIGELNEFRNLLSSPDQRHGAFSKDNDIHLIAYDSGEITQLTTGGTPALLNGELDWVYQEELYGRGNWRAFWWSPDSSRLAFLSLDTSKVPLFRMTDDKTHPQGVEDLCYPKAGEPNPVAALGVVDLKGNVQWLENPYPDHETLISRVGFDPEGRVLAAWQDRIQSWYDLRRYEGEKGITLVKDISTSWIDRDRMPLPRYLKDGTFILESNRSGYHHIYHHDADGRALGAITAGDWMVYSIQGIDEKNKRIYFTANKDSYAGADAYSVKFGGKAPNDGVIRYTSESGRHRVSWNPTFTLFVDSWNNHADQGRQQLKDHRGNVLRVLNDRRNAAAPFPFPRGQARHQLITTSDGFQMESMLILPPEMEPGKKYPVFQTGYGGPDSPTVRDAWNDNAWHHFLANQDFIVWMCDPRSASDKGQVHTEKVYGRLGELELQDYLDGLRWLGAQGFADMSRVAIDGWSYGGYMAAYAMAKGGGAYKLGLAGAPVTDYRLYDSIYTERFMGHPNDNPDGYDSTSIMKSIADLKGSLLIFHGLMDENVHPQNTIQLVDALIEAGKDFEVVILPGAGHGPSTPYQRWVVRLKTWEALKKL
ncbi:MAG: S9 family peptidase [Holophagales bacterium]|jgi:dipeptidyl-peptidase-4|nr:S9 family peptidase [Holophagales bacterium]